MNNFTKAFHSGYIRKLNAADIHRLQDHFLRLSSEARRMRFSASVADEFLIEYAETSFQKGSVLHGYYEDGEVRAVSELRTDSIWKTHEAEAAFSVESQWQGKGIGTELFVLMLRSARNRGISKLQISCLAWNKPMRALATKFKADLHLEEGDIVGTILPTPASAASIMDEIIEDGIAKFAPLSAGKLLINHR